MKDGLLERIRAVGHWRVNIRPRRTLEEKLTLLRCSEEVERARVSIRGWDYPHISRRQDNQGGSARFGDYVENWCDWHTQVEFWRMYRSGQFLSYNAVGQDIDAEGGRELAVPVLGILDANYSVTEFVEFAHRLFANGVHREGTQINIALENTAGRQLWVGPNRMPFFEPRRTEADSLRIERSLQPDDWAAGPIEVALSILLELFDHFGWNPDPGQIRSDQERFYRREF